MVPAVRSWLNLNLAKSWIFPELSIELKWSLFNECAVMVILRKKVHFSLTDFIRTATPWGPYVPSLTVRRSFSGPIQNIFSGSSAYKHKHTRTYVVTRRRSNYIIYYLVYYIKSDHWPALQPYIWSSMRTGTIWILKNRMVKSQPTGYD